MNIYLLFSFQIALQLIYCTFSYTDFKNNSYFPYAAMFCGLISQLIWSQILKSAQSHTAATVSSVFYDSVTFIIWSMCPLIFFGSSFNRTGVAGILLVIIGMTLVGLQDV